MSSPVPTPRPEHRPRCRCKGSFTINGQPWVRLVVIGQSFMLHQIRKMVGLAMAVYRGAAPVDAIPIALRARISALPGWLWLNAVEVVFPVPS